MKNLITARTWTIALTLLLLGAAPVAASWNCLPTCSAQDGRFFSVAYGQGDLVTHELYRAEIQLIAPGNANRLVFSIFDGESSQAVEDAICDWDIGATVDYSYKVYVDPNGDGKGTVRIGPIWTSAAMLSDQWRNFILRIPDGTQKSPSGNYVFNLTIEKTDPTDTQTSMNVFKVRAQAPAQVHVRPMRLANYDQPAWSNENIAYMTADPAAASGFCFIANFASYADGQVVYPYLNGADGNQPEDRIGARYNGTFSFFFEVPAGRANLDFYDADFDHCSYDHAELDNDDPDTPPDAFLTWWPRALPEGVQLADYNSPPDDVDPNASPPSYFMNYWPSVFYSVVSPYGQMWINENPSGNLEFERFRIGECAVAPSNRSTQDVDALCGSIKAGVYSLRVYGLDMQNLVHIAYPFRTVCVTECGETCIPLQV